MRSFNITYSNTYSKLFNYYIGKYYIKLLIGVNNNVNITLLTSIPFGNLFCINSKLFKLENKFWQFISK